MPAEQSKIPIYCFKFVNMIEQSKHIESLSIAETAPELPALPVRRTLATTLAFLLMLLLFASVFMNEASAQQGITLGGGDAPAEESKPTLDLGPAPSAGGSTGGAATGQGSLADLARTKHGDWDVACEKSGSPCVMAQILSLIHI